MYIRRYTFAGKYSSVFTDYEFIKFTIAPNVRRTLTEKFGIKAKSTPKLQVVQLSM